MVTDVIIIGGGAAGLCAAVHLKQKNPKISIRVMEAMPRVCKKLLVTGNGRCNITNKDNSLSNFHGENIGFARFALEKYGVDTTYEFFENIGVPFVFEGNKGYPASLQASSVVDSLRFSAENLGVIIHTEAKVTNIQIQRGKYKVSTNTMSFLAENVVIACGLLSGGDRLGSDGSMLELLKKAGFKAIKTSPAIVQLKTETDIVKQLKGIKVDATVSLFVGNRACRKEFGEVLFCDYGLSGPPVMQVSREVSRTKEQALISLDLMPDTDFFILLNSLIKRRSNLGYRALEEFLTGMLNKRLGQVIVKSIGLKLNEKAENLTDKNLEEIAKLIKDFRFKVIGTTGYSNSQVTAGGLDTTQFNEKTMEAKSNKGLYAIGEILDIDGDCGGFNLMWAWASAICAAESILRGYKK